MSEILAEKNWPLLQKLMKFNTIVQVAVVMTKVFSKAHPTISQKIHLVAHNKLNNLFKAQTPPFLPHPQEINAPWIAARTKTVYSILLLYFLSLLNQLLEEYWPSSIRLFNNVFSSIKCTFIISCAYLFMYLLIILRSSCLMASSTFSRAFFISSSPCGKNHINQADVSGPATLTDFK